MTVLDGERSGTPTTLGLVNDAASAGAPSGAARRRSSGPRGRGRPRDPALEERARLAALDLFGKRGLSGLTIDEVAATAKIGKSSLYLRWPDKESLLADALRGIQGADQPEGVEDGVGAEALGDEDDDAVAAPPQSLREYLLAHVHRRAELYLGRYGLAMLRLYAEARAHPELFGEIREQAISRLVLAERERVADAVRSGVLPPDASPVRILDAVEGAIFMHVLVTPPELLDRVRAGLDVYVERMVDDQLRAAGYDAEADVRHARRNGPSRTVDADATDGGRAVAGAAPVQTAPDRPVSLRGS